MSISFIFWALRMVSHMSTSFDWYKNCQCQTWKHVLFQSKSMNNDGILKQWLLFRTSIVKTMYWFYYEHLSNSFYQYETRSGSLDNDDENQHGLDTPALDLSIDAFVHHLCSTPKAAKDSVLFPWHIQPSCNQPSPIIDSLASRSCNISRKRKQTESSEVAKPSERRHQTFTCSLCFQTFRFHGTFQSHLRTHTGNAHFSAEHVKNHSETGRRSSNMSEYTQASVLMYAVCAIKLLPNLAICCVTKGKFMMFHVDLYVIFVYIMHKTIISVMQ